MPELEKAYAARKKGNHALAFMNESFFRGPDLFRIASYFNRLQDAKDETAKDTEPDIRFTCKPGVLYIMARSWKEPWVRVQDLLLTPEQKITGIELLGYSGKIDYTLQGNGIEMSLPSDYRPEIPLYVYKLTLSE